MNASILTKNQVKTFTKTFTDTDGKRYDIVANVRHDDRCGNGHNTFSITGDIYKAGRRGDEAFITGGCIHDDIAKHFPELAPFIRWHLTSTDGPMHYVANTCYLACEARELDAARRAAVWPDATDAELSLPRELLAALLEARLPALLAQFRTDVESLGFVY